MKLLRLRTVLLFVLSLWVVAMGVAYTMAEQRIVSADELTKRDVALVLGASVLPDKRPSAVLHDRVVAAVDLFRAGKVQRLLLSGKSEQHYDEVAAMRRLALELSVPSEAILIDVDGLRTYDSCFHAKHVFHADNVVLVTQQYHLPRAIFLCRAVGLDAVGVSADRSHYEREWRFLLRELGAWALAVIDAV